MKFKICLVGCGRHSAQVHGPSLRKYAEARRDVELAAVCDLNRERAEAFAREFGFARVYSDVAEMVRLERPQAASVVLPPEWAGPACRVLLERGIPVLIEKPPALTRAALQHLIDWADAGRAPTQVAFNRRYMPMFVEARRLLAEHTSPPEVSRIDYDMIRCDRRDADFSTTAIHAIDAVLFLARSPYREARIDYQERPDLGPGVANISIEGVCQSGTRVHIGFHPVAGVVMERFAAYADRRSLFVEVPLWNAGGTLRYWENDVLTVERTDKAGDAGDLCDWSGFAEENRAFFDAVREGREFGPSLREAEQPVVLMEAIRNRARQVQFELVDAN